MDEVERLLVVDDEAPILHALQRTFEAAGYQVTACADPAEALERLKEKPYQVLSADYMMPGMSGAEFLARARSVQPETIRILITAAHDFSAAVDAINNGEIFRILAKPWNRVELLGTVRQAFDTYALREKNQQLTALVQKLINMIFSEGQLDECDLTLKDLNVITQSFVRTLEGIYHARPQYPAAAIGNPVKPQLTLARPAEPAKKVSS